MNGRIGELCKSGQCGLFELTSKIMRDPKSGAPAVMRKAFNVSHYKGVDRSLHLALEALVTEYGRSSQRESAAAERAARAWRNALAHTPNRKM